MSRRVGGRGPFHPDRAVKHQAERLVLLGVP
jgi:hypothetical protein